MQGLRVPCVVFKTRVRDERAGGENPFRWQDVSSNELFAGRRVVVFSLPGAFTPVCSNEETPEYERRYDEIRALGIDEIYCIAETELERGEIIISIQVPASAMAGRSHYLKIRERASYEFALVSAAVGIDMQGPNIHDARIALGGVAPKPWRLRGAEQVLRGVALSDAAALRHALDIDFPHAKPGHRNGFKVELAKRIAAIRRSCVHRWAASVWWPLRSQWTSWRINSGWTRSNCG